MPRRRKPSSSAFEFTGEEALAAERAFQRRHAKTSRKPKISVTSISPLSTINKVLHPRRAHTEKAVDVKLKKEQPQNVDSATKRNSKPVSVTQPSPSESVVPPSTPPKSSRLSIRKAVARPPSSQDSTPSTPSRRSRRRRLPSFKLRKRSTNPTEEQLDQPDAEEPVPVRVRIRNPRQSLGEGRVHHPDEAMEDELSKDTGPGEARPERTAKRPHEGAESDDVGMHAVPTFKKLRGVDDAESAAGEHGKDDVDITRGTDFKDKEPLHGQAGADASEKDGDSGGSDNDIEKDRDDGDAKNEEKMIVDSMGENAINDEDGADDDLGNRLDDQKDKGDKKKQFEQGEPITGDSVAKQDPPTEDKISLQEETSTAGMTSAKAAELAISTRDTEENQAAEAIISSDIGSSGGTSSAGASETVKCVRLQPNTSTISPVTPLKPDVGPAMSENPPEALPTKESSNSLAHHSDQSMLRPEQNDKPLAELAISAATTPEKDAQALNNSDCETPVQGVPSGEKALHKSITDSGSEETITGKTRDREEVVHGDGAAEKKDSKPTSDSAVPGGTPTDKIKEEMVSKDEFLPNESKALDRMPMCERNSPAKATASVMKRVRFTEPPPSYRSSEKKMGFSGIIKMRRRRVRKHRALDADYEDVSVVAAGRQGPDEKGRHLLLDELQYLLDGIFKMNANGAKKSPTADSQVVASSLQSLVKLLLRKSKGTGSLNEDRQEEDSGILVRILVEQPDLLKTIVKRLCTVLGKSRASDALLSLVFVIVFRTTPKMLLLTEHELDLLLNAFFRNSAASLKEDERETQNSEDVPDNADKEPQSRRRGRLSRLFDQKKPKDDVLTPLVKLMIEAEVVEDKCNSFKRETEAASHLMGIAIALVLRNQIETQAWMRENRRLDKVVAVLYSCEKMMLSQTAGEDDLKRPSVSRIEQSASWIIMEASMRVLEFAVLDQVCQRRLAHESRVSNIIIGLLRTIKSIKTGPMESEWMICAALRLCINLCYGCESASKQLVDGNGQKIVLNCLVKECLAAGLLKEDMKREQTDEVEESFDVRVLCLAVLASTVNQEIGACNTFHEMHAEGVEKRERAAISLILEILRTAESEAKKEEVIENGDEVEQEIRRRKRTTKEEDAERERRAQFVMERKITIGYICLLIGALACNSKSNRELMQDILPGKSFIGVAAVLAEFLEFHHEVGVISGSMNRMYAEIIKKIVEPETRRDSTVDGTEEDGMDEDLNVDEGQDDACDLLINSQDSLDDGDCRTLGDLSTKLMAEVAVDESEGNAGLVPSDAEV